MMMYDELQWLKWGECKGDWVVVLGIDENFYMNNEDTGSLHFLG